MQPGNEDHCKKMVESYILISDDELDISYNVSPDRQHSGNISLAKYFAGQKGKDLDHNPAQNNKNLDFCKDVLFHSNTKRKRSYNVVMSESESVHNDDEVGKVTDSQMPRHHGLKRIRKNDSIIEVGHKKEEIRGKRVSIMPKYLEDYIITNYVKRS